jgi:hypothetical protein
VFRFAQGPIQGSLRHVFPQAAVQLAHAGATRDDNEVSGQATLPFELPKNRVVFFDNLQHDLRDYIFNILRLKRHAEEIRAVADDVENQPQKAIHKGAPRAGFVIEAALQQSTVPVAGWHGRPQDEAKRNLQDILPRPNLFQKSVFS